MSILNFLCFFLNKRHIEKLPKEKFISIRYFQATFQVLKAVRMKMALLSTDVFCLHYQGALMTKTRPDNPEDGHIPSILCCNALSSLAKILI